MTRRRLLKLKESREREEELTERIKELRAKRSPTRQLDDGAPPADRAQL